MYYQKKFNTIHSNQTGYVKDRCIGETVRSLLDIVEFTNIENNLWYSRSFHICFEKALYMLEWDFFLKCLKGVYGWVVRIC